ncbi:retrovirus-related pol polyprotein from transposon TNT 1-94 [Tanacetum coccineum]
MWVKTIAKTSFLLNEIENLKTRLKGKMPSITSDTIKSKVFIVEKYAIDVGPIPSCYKNNRNVHPSYLNRLKDTLDTLHEIVKEARNERSSDNDLEYVCIYTKTSQELLEHVIASCPKAVNKRDKFIATTPFARKKQVTFAEPCETSNNNTSTHVKQQNEKKTNVPVLPSTRVNGVTKASGSEPKSNTKNDMTSPAKSVPKKTVEDHLRNNKSTTSTSGPTVAKPQATNAPVSYRSSCVRFGNNHFGAIMGYEDYVIGDSVISRVYYVEGIGHNLFSIRQFCDSDFEVAFRNSCYVRDLKGVDLLKGHRGSNLCTISVEDTMKSSPICLLSKASQKKSWLWYRRLNHLNFCTINNLARKDLVRGLPRLKFEKDHLCSACQLRKSKNYSHKPKMENTNLEVLHTLHIELCELISKDETPDFVVTFLKQIQVGLNKTVRFIRTNNGTEFVNHVLTAFYEQVDITHQTSVLRTPQQNGIVERRNRTLVEVARTMLIYAKASMFLWAEAVATACYTQNRSLIHTRYNKPLYDLVHDKKPNLLSFRVFGALWYLTNDSEDLGKLKAKADIKVFVGPEPSLLTHGPISSGLVRNLVPATPYAPPTNKDLEMLFQPMYDEYLEPSSADRPTSPAPAVQAPVSLVLQQSVAAGPDIDANPFVQAFNDPFVNVFAPEPSSKE